MISIKRWIKKSGEGHISEDNITFKEFEEAVGSIPEIINLLKSNNK